MGIWRDVREEEYDIASNVVVELIYDMRVEWAVVLG